MADRYWVGGTGTWSNINTANWSTTSGGSGGASVPTLSDAVFFDAGSDAGSSFTVTLGQNSGTPCNAFTASNLDYTVSFSGIFSSQVLNVFGSFTLPGTNVSWGISDTRISGGVITTNGTTLSSSVRISGSLGSNLTVTGSITFSSGSFDTGGYNITCGNFILSGSVTRTLNLNSSTVNCFGWDATTTTNLTFNSGTSIINMSGSTFSGGSLTYYNVGFTATTTGTTTISGANTFNNLTFNSLTSSGLRQISFPANQTINGTFTVSTSSATRRYFIRSNTFGTQRTLTCAAVSFTNVDFRDTVIAGVAAPATGTRLGNCGNNSGITFTAAANKHWVSASSANWNSNAWAISSGGAAGVDNFPLPQDTAIIDDSALTASQTVTLNTFYNYSTIDTSARTNAMTLGYKQDCIMVGGLLVGSGVTIDDSAGPRYFVFVNDSLQPISGDLERFKIDGFLTGGVQLVGAASASGTGLVGSLNLVNGTLDLNGYTLTLVEFFIYPGTKNVTFNGGTIAVTGSGADAWYNIGSTNFTTTAGSGTGAISMTSVSAKTFTGGGSTYNCTLNQGGAGTLTIAGANTFGDITKTHAGSSTISLGANQTVSNFTLSGTVGNVITFNSSSSGTRRNISKASGTVSVTFLNIKDSNGTGGATWDAYASTGNVDGGNNLGWNFAPPTSGSNMFMLFD